MALPLVSQSSSRMSACQCLNGCFRTSRSAELGTLPPFDVSGALRPGPLIDARVTNRSLAVIAALRPSDSNPARPLTHLGAKCSQQRHPFGRRRDCREPQPCPWERTPGAEMPPPQFDAEHTDSVAPQIPV